MKVYIVYEISDFYGINIIKIFAKETDAIEYCAFENNNREKYEKIDYEEYEVE